MAKRLGRDPWNLFSSPYQSRFAAYGNAAAFRQLGEILHREECLKLAEMLPKSRALRMMHSMHPGLVAIWGHSMATRDQLLKHLQDGCQCAESSGVDELQRFSRKLRSYTL